MLLPRPYCREWKLGRTWPKGHSLKDASHRELGMQHSGNRQSLGSRFASIAFGVAPGIGWRLHMSKVAAEMRSILAPRKRSKR